jgi:hypothetical protein
MYIRCKVAVSDVIRHFGRGHIGSRTFHNDRFSPLSHGQNQKISPDSNSPYRETPGYKKLADFLENSNFLS